MKFSILKDYLNDSIGHVAKAISSRTTIPILSGIKIDASINGVLLTASDTDIAIQSFIAMTNKDLTVVELERPGSVVLPAKFFMELIRKLPMQQIEIEVIDQFKTIIRSGSSEVQIMGLDPEEFPSLPQVETDRMFQMPSDLLKMMIKQTSFAVSTNETTPILTGVLWDLKESNLKFVGCDRHRLAQREIGIEVDANFKVPPIAISGRTMNELSKILPDQNVLIDIVIADNQALFKVQSILFFTRILDGTYPDTTKLIPSAFQTEMVVPTDKLAEAIDRAYLLSREEKTNIVRLIMKDDKTIEISSSSSELGKVTENIEVHSLRGELLKISFNSKYMLDALKAIDADFIKIGFTGAMQPIIMKPEDGTEVLQLILPYRTPQ